MFILVLVFSPAGCVCIQCPVFGLVVFFFHLHMTVVPRRNTGKLGDLCVAGEGMLRFHAPAAEELIVHHLKSTRTVLLNAQIQVRLVTFSS